jgi:hypothetical protein
VKQRSIKTRNAEPLRSHDISQLAVLVRFGDLVVAVPAQRVSRIAMADEAVPARGAAPSVRIGDAVMPAWSLGKLLGFSEPPAAWLVMTTGDEPGAPQIALGTGPCIAIAPHGNVSSLPTGVVSASPAAVIGVFVTDAALRERGLSQLGVRIDPMRLIGSPLPVAAQRGER